MIFFFIASKSCDYSTLKFTEEGLTGMDTVGGLLGSPSTITISGKLDPETSDGSPVTSSSGPGVRVSSGRTITSATLKLGEDGGLLSGLKVRHSSSPSIKIGGESVAGGSSNLVIGKSGPVKVTNLLPSVHQVPSSGLLTVVPPSTGSSDVSSSDEKSRSPVYAQILSDLKQRQPHSSASSIGLSGTTPKLEPSSYLFKKGSASLSAFTSPLVLSRQRDSSANAPVSIVPTLSSTQLTPISGSLSSPAAVNPVAFSASKRTTAKRQRAQLTQILSDPQGVAAADSTDCEIGKAFSMEEVPSHLIDHTYSFYNPGEGEKIAPCVTVMTGKMSRSASTIPPVRVSYAPQVKGDNLADDD